MYTSFKDMYVHNYSEMIAAGVSQLLNVPKWQDKEGKEVSEANTYECKVTHKLTDPNYCIVLDGVGMDIN